MSTNIDDLFKGANLKGKKRELPGDSGDEASDQHPSKRLNSSSNGQNGDVFEANRPELSSREREIQAYIDSRDENSKENSNVTKEVYDRRFLSKLLVTLEKAANQNTDMRLRYKSDPSRFYDSENSLYEAIRALSIISETELYSDLEKSGSIETLVSLITHDNLMIGIQVIQILEELLEPTNDVVEPAEMTSLTKSLINEGLSEQLRRFLKAIEVEAKEQVKRVKTGELSKEEVFEGFQNILNLVTNIMTNDTETGLKLVQKMDLISWITKRFTRNTEAEEDVNDGLDVPPRSAKYQVAEFFAQLFIMVPESIKFVTKDLVDMFLLEVDILRTRKRVLLFNDDDKADYEAQSDFLRDIFDSLIASLRFSWVNSWFIELEGIDLMLLYLQKGDKGENDADSGAGKENEWVRLKALKVLVESTRAFNGSAKRGCEAVVEAGGLKPLFSLLRKNKKKAVVWELVTIFGNLLEWLDINSPARLRLCAKFGEKSCASLNIIVQLYKNVVSKLLREEQIEAERLRTLAEFGISSEQLATMEKDEQDEEKEREKQKLHARRNGLGVVIAWLVVEYEELRKKVVEKEGVSILDIKKSLSGYLKDVKEGNSLLDEHEDKPRDDKKTKHSDKYGRDEKVESLIRDNDRITCDMLETLISQLE